MANNLNPNHRRGMAFDVLNLSLDEYDDWGMPLNTDKVSNDDNWGLPLNSNKMSKNTWGLPLNSNKMSNNDDWGLPLNSNKMSNNDDWGLPLNSNKMSNDDTWGLANDDDWGLPLNSNRMSNKAQPTRQLQQEWSLPAGTSFSLFVEQQQKIIEQYNARNRVVQPHSMESDARHTNPRPRTSFTSGSTAAAVDVARHCPCPPSPPRPTTHLSTYEEIDTFAEMRRRAEECDLIDLSDPPVTNGGHDDKNDENERSESPSNELQCPNSGDLWELPSAGWTIRPMLPSASSVPSTFRPDKLPRRAIVYDYTTQPIGVIEHKRFFLPPAQADARVLLSYPFLRPLLLDGVGLVKAYRGCCTENSELPDRSHPYELHFPLMPIVRCLFYWISRGHRTVLCFSQQFSPMGDEIFQATDEDKRKLKLLEENGMADFFKHDNSKEWFDQKGEELHGCLVTTTTTGDGTTVAIDFLQPFYDHKGNSVFFSLYNSKNQCVDSVVLMDDVSSKEQFEEVDRNQLAFMEQVLQLKILFDLLPKGARFREKNLMVEVFTRLKPFL
ncbi:hypothetical protein GPALN_001984 [Globodera pallida]|nr:hypothetical protein GPALN_001984 [Globodera pallida]